MKRENVAATYLVNLCFWLYFIILMAERVYTSVITQLNDGNPKGEFGVISFLVLGISLAVWFVYIIMFCRDSVIYLFNVKNGVNLQNLAIASGIILLSGMIHTPNTMTWLQFISYGILIFGMLIYVLASQPNLKKWFSFFYLVAFSMAIPVIYQSEMKSHVFFHITEAVATLALVGLFTYLLYHLFGGKDDLMDAIPFFVALLMDAAVIVWRWDESINYFVLVAISVTALLFLVGKLYIIIKDSNKGENDENPELL